MATLHVFIVVLLGMLTESYRFSSRNMHHVMNDAMYNVRQHMRSESKMASKMYNVEDCRPYRYVTAFLYAKPYAKYISHAGNLLMEVAKQMKRRRTSTHHEKRLLRPMRKAAVPDTKMAIPPDIYYCPYPETYICDKFLPFRTIDGSCNNLQRPIWGRSMTPHRRLLPANYGDGKVQRTSVLVSQKSALLTMTNRYRPKYLSDPLVLDKCGPCKGSCGRAWLPGVESMRRSVTGSRLPAARYVSRHMFPERDRPSDIHTLLLMIWGQFIDHDITRTAIAQTAMDHHGFGRTDEVKCGYDGCDSGGPGLEACWPIPVTADDPDFGYSNKCLKFVRSQGVPPLNCKPGHKETLNQVTPWIDGSQIYGSTPKESSVIRDYSNPERGWMLMTPHPHGPQWKNLLPQQDFTLCRDTNATIKCFLAGDERVNEQSGLTAMHTAWVRQHNRIEAQLKKVNPHWKGDRLFKEARRIVGALIQHIVVNEQLPLVLGAEVMQRYDLEPVKRGFYDGYNPSYHPQIAQAFSSAAYRFGHTLIQDRFRRTNYKYHQDNSVMLSDAFRRPVHVYDTSKGGVDSLLRGLCDFEAQRFDRFFTNQITRSLFTERPPYGLGMDLLSLNIQRGRDHGIPGYNFYRGFCGLRRAKTFEDLSKEIPSSRTRAILRRIYKHVDDIDLFPGGVSERSVPGGLVGPTFACILGNQFQHAKKGDRFWYENFNSVGFTSDQLKEIKKIRLSRIICANGDYVDSIQPYAMMKPFREVYSHLATESFDANLMGMSYKDFNRLYEDDFNARVPCSSLPDIDFRHWKNGPYVG